MCYEQADYEAEMDAAGEAEAAAGYDEYLDSLVEARELYIYVLHVAEDLLNTTKFAKSGLPASEYFTKLRKEHYDSLKPKPIVTPERVPGICITCKGTCNLNELECSGCDLPF